MMVKLMTRLTKGDHAAAEDIVQEAFLRAIQFQGSYDEERATYHTWFNGILWNCLRDYNRSLRGDPAPAGGDISADDVAEELDLLDTPEGQQYTRNQIELVKNDKHRRVLELFFLLGYTSKQITQIEEDVSVTNVTTIVSRFKEDLKPE